jgi:hypothetical protein
VGQKNLGGLQSQTLDFRPYPASLRSGVDYPALFALLIRRQKTILKKRPDGDGVNKHQAELEVDCGG